MTVRAQEQMSNFVGYDAAQNNGDLKLRVVTLGATQHIVVIDTGENRYDCENKDFALEPILGGLREYPQLDVSSFEGPLTRFLPNAGQLPHRAIQPQGRQTSLAEDSACFAFGPGYGGG